MYLFINWKGFFLPRNHKHFRQEQQCRYSKFSTTLGWTHQAGKQWMSEAIENSLKWIIFKFFAKIVPDRFEDTPGLVYAWPIISGCECFLKINFLWTTHTTHCRRPYYTVLRYCMMHAHLFIVYCTTFANVIYYGLCYQKTCCYVRTEHTSTLIVTLNFTIIQHLSHKVIHFLKKALNFLWEFYHVHLVILEGEVHKRSFGTLYSILNLF